MYFCLIKQFHRSVIDNHETGYLYSIHFDKFAACVHLWKPSTESRWWTCPSSPKFPQALLNSFSSLSKPVVCFLSLYTLLHCLLFHLNGVMQYVLLKTWVLWLRISSSSVLQQVPAVHFFSRLTSVPIYGDTTNFLFIHFLFHPFHHVVDIWVVCSF